VSATDHPGERRWPVLLVRALTLRCPNCGGRPIIRGWLHLADQCPRCGLRPQRGESDYFIGAYLVNLIAIELLFAGGLVAAIVATWPSPPWALLQAAALVLTVGGAVFCYPFTKLVWLAFDLSLRPLTARELEWHRQGAPDDATDLPQR
jgi:uncharacterized protein (DUF983 family)